MNNKANESATAGGGILVIQQRVRIMASQQPAAGCVKEQDITVLINRLSDLAQQYVLRILILYLSMIITISNRFNIIYYNC